MTDFSGLFGEPVLDLEVTIPEGVIASLDLVREDVRIKFAHDVSRLLDSCKRYRLRVFPVMTKEGVSGDECVVFLKEQGDLLLGLHTMSIARDYLEGCSDVVGRCMACFQEKETLPEVGGMKRVLHFRCSSLASLPSVSLGYYDYGLYRVEVQGKEKGDLLVSVSPILS